MRYPAHTTAASSTGTATLFPTGTATPTRTTTGSRVTRSTLALVSTLALSGCVAVVPVERAPQAIAPACAAVVVRLPDTIARGTDQEQPRRETNTQGTAAWGNPASVILRCGETPPGPTTERCINVNSVDWIIDETDAPHYRFTTYGRTPAVQVIVDNSRVSGTTTITDLAAAVSTLPRTGACTGIGDAPSTPSPTAQVPAPTRGSTRTTVYRAPRATARSMSHANKSG
ncbi:MAG: hypothetical protein B5766_02240 [Candidatus Lumbricidophila eiseniae]|uniref:DUF3515 domain-containing protein n=1 Tax=Candidatus Lumbricidiphila eiseniae TaxID=1969409 RepID=A0A2A6FTN8_9MICO|nr:MAG: hypothetical protein B5766_02240 [Candidatus Lumbricidophila eiseniae]